MLRAATGHLSCAGQFLLKANVLTIDLKDGAEHFLPLEPASVLLMFARHIEHLAASTNIMPPGLSSQGGRAETVSDAPRGAAGARGRRRKNTEAQRRACVFASSCPAFRSARSLISP